MINVRTQNILNIMYGDTQVIAVHIGSQKVWPEDKEINSIQSCFASGHWIDEYPWTDNLPWTD